MHEQLDALRSRVGALTPTERKVFDLVVRGKLNKQIAWSSARPSVRSNGTATT